MCRITEIELDQLLAEYEKNPNDLDIINLIALGYFENYEKKTDKEDYDFFEKAYNLKKTVKSTHNFAWFLYFEWAEIQWRWNKEGGKEKALDVQKECIALSPNSYYPYYQYAYMLINKEEYEEAIKYLTIAKSKIFFRGIEHNLGYCYFKLGLYELAQKHFLASCTSEDLILRSHFNLALTEYKLNNSKKFSEIIDRLQNPLENEGVFCSHSIGILLFMIDEFERSTQWTINQGLEYIDLLDWTELAYSFYIANRKVFDVELKKGISKRQVWIEELNENHSDWDEYSDDEKKEEICKFQSEIRYRENIEIEFREKPTVNFDKLLTIDPIYCLLFDCTLHGNLKDDYSNSCN